MTPQDQGDLAESGPRGKKGLKWVSSMTLRLTTLYHDPPLITISNGCIPNSIAVILMYETLKSVHRGLRGKFGKS